MNSPISIESSLTPSLRSLYQMGHKASKIAESLNFFQHVLEYGSTALWMCAFFSISFKFYRGRSALGISLQTLYALTISKCSQVVYDFLINLIKSNLSEFWILEFISALSAICASRYIKQNSGTSYESKRDTFGKNFTQFAPYINTQPRGHWYFLYFISFVMAIPLMIFRKADLSFPLNLWQCYNESLSSLALIPQVYMFYTRESRVINALIAQFVIFLLGSRFLKLLYWALFPITAGYYPAGRGIFIGTNTLNILILINFLNHFIKSKVEGTDNIRLPF